MCIYLKYEALEDGECSGCKGMEAEHNIVELDGVDSGRVTMKILPLDNRQVQPVSVYSYYIHVGVQLQASCYNQGS